MNMILELEKHEDFCKVFNLKIIIYCNSNSIITSTVDIKNSWLLITIDILQIILFN